MHIKRFEGRDMKEALQLVREELGADALVLSTRTLTKGRNFFGAFGRNVVEITAAVDRDVRQSAEVSPPTAAVVEKPRTRPHESWNELRLTQALIHPLEEEVRQLRGALERASHQHDASATRDLREEVAAIRRVALDLRASQRVHDSAVSPTEAALLEVGLAERHRITLASGNAADRVDLLARLLDSALSPPRPENNTATLYVGPAGVGKTTTLAKVASRTEIGRTDLAVLSTDVHRLAAETPLKSWADRRGIPFESESSASGLATRISRIGNRPIFVDTAGRSRNDEAGIRELEQMRDALGARARVCLVLPATRKESDLREDLERFRVLAPDSLAITSIDESRYLGNVANLLLDGDCPPLNWLGTGQRVPNDLEVADPFELANLILGAAA